MSMQSQLRYALEAMKRLFGEEFMRNRVFNWSFKYK